MTDVVIYGNGHMAVLADLDLSRDSDFDVVAFTVEGSYLNESSALERVPSSPWLLLSSSICLVERRCS